MDDETPRFQLLPPPPTMCQVCAVLHRVEEPHNRQSLFYQLWFYQREGRWPTWQDAMAHCSADVQAVWQRELATFGIVLESTG